MYNFVYRNPVKLLFGTGVLDHLGREVAEAGTKVLLVYGEGTIKTNGIYERVISSLEKAGVHPVDHGGVRPNPLLSHVQDGIEKARGSGCMAILGVGGGSSMDSAKAIAAGCCAGHDVWKFFTGKKSVRQALPVFCVPTAAGTGSEMNSGMVLSHDRQGVKLGFAHRMLFPRASFVDPELTFTVAARQTGYGTVDTICHCLEAYLSTQADQALFQQRLMENICRTAIETCRNLEHDPRSYNDRATSLWIAAIALSGIATAGLGKIGFPMHLLEHAVSAHFDVPHGAGLASVLPGWLEFRFDSLKHRLAQLGSAIFDLRSDDVQDSARQTISGLTDFLKEISCPTNLSDLGVTSSDLPRLTEHCLEQARIWRMTDFSAEVIQSALTHCLQFRI